MPSWDAVAAVAGLGGTIVALLVFTRELRRGRRYDETAQISRVCAWLEPTPEGVDLVVRNDSDSPIFGVVTSEFSVKPRWPIASMIPPHGEVRRQRFDVDTPIELEDLTCHAIALIDARGRHWTWWGAEGVPAEPDNKDFTQHIFERRTARTAVELERQLNPSSLLR